MSRQASSASDPAEGANGASGGRTSEQATLISAQAALVSAMVAAAGLVIAAVPALIGVLAWKDQQQQNQRLRVDREQRQASLVSTWITTERIEGERRGVVVIANRSQDPVHDTKVKVNTSQAHPIYGSFSIALVFGTIPPCTQVRISSNAWLGKYARTSTTFVADGKLKKLRLAPLAVSYVGFMDQFGKRWYRTGAAGPTRSGDDDRFFMNAERHLRYVSALGTDALPIREIKECDGNTFSAE